MPNDNSSCYAAYEHSSLNSFPPPSSTTASLTRQSTKPNLPLDITLETILSVVLICVGLVSGADELKPISWRIWAHGEEKENSGGGPYQGLEERIGFVDIRVCSGPNRNPKFSRCRRGLLVGRIADEANKCICRIKGKILQIGYGTKMIIQNDIAGSAMT